jgi:transcriptional regulator with XRE-family HTH domain
MSAPEPRQNRQIQNPEELGVVIAELRSLRRKTQFEVSSALGIDRSQLAHLEGGRSGRYLAHLLNILEHLGAELQIQWPGVLVETTPPARTMRSRSPVQPVADPAGSVSAEAPTASSESRAPAEVKAKDESAGQGCIVESESTSAQLTKITNQAMNVMAASQRLTLSPSRQPPDAIP